MIAAIATIRGDTDICGITAAHLLNEGVDRLYIAVSGDEAWEVLEPLGPEVRLFRDIEQYHRQPQWTEYLANIAHEGGAEYVIPWDADEFIYACNGESIATVLADCPFDKLYLRSYQHTDFYTRHVAAKRLPKVAFRWQPNIRMELGNHGCSVPNGQYGILDLREWQYRSFQHYKQKITERHETLDPTARAAGAGHHHERLVGLSEEGLRDEWDQMMAIPTMYDPIPTQLPLSCLFGVLQN